MLRRRCRRAFSLVEILVVISIIVLLVGLGAVGFSAFREQAQRQQTIGLLQNVHAITTEYQVATGSSYDPDEDPDCDPNDAPTGMNIHEFYLECFIRDAWDIPEVEPVVRQLDGFLRVRDGNELRPMGTGESPEDVDVTVVDRWGNPLRYFYRSTDSDDVHGVPPHHRPFVASAGPDGQWGVYVGDGANEAADNLFSFELD